MTTRDPNGRFFFTVYDTTTGRVLRSGYCPFRDHASQTINAGEALIEGQARPDVDTVILGATPTIQIAPPS